MTTQSNQIMQKICNKYICNICDYSTCRKSSINNHVASAKHQNNLIDNAKQPDYAKKYAKNMQQVFV